MHILLWLLTGAIVGWATGWLMVRKRYGSAVDAAIGVFGAVIFGFMIGSFGLLCPGSILEALLVAAVGASLLTFIVRRLKAPATA